MNKSLRGVFVLLFIFFSTNSYSQSLFETLEQSFKNDTDNYPKLIQKYLNQSFQLSNIPDTSEVKFHPFFLDNLIFNNKNEVLALSLRDECSLIDLLGTELLYSSSGKLQYVLIQFKNKAGNEEIHSLDKNRYLNLIGYKKCPNSRKLKAYFNFNNIRKTLSKEKILFPKSLSECKTTHENFTKNVKAPYLCEIAKSTSELEQKKIELKNLSKANFRAYETLSREVLEAETYEKVINPAALNFLTNLCDHSYDSSRYCEDIFAETYWSNAVKGLVSKYPLETFCSEYLKKETLSKNDLQVCSNAFAANPEICKNGLNKSESLTPTPNCTELSNALNFSRLYKDFRDCPARVGHAPLVTASRMITHFNKTTIENAPTCETYSIYPFAKFNQDFLESELWQMQICYEDRILRKKTCMPTLLNGVSNSELSLSYTVGKVLARLRGFNDKDQSCRVINESEYRPTLLEFKTGCFVIKKDDRCLGTSCEFKVVLDDQAFTNYTFESKLQFDLFPYRFTEANKSFLKLAEKNFNKDSKKILNISSLKRVFSEKKDAVIMATGCLEDLLPSFTQARRFNQCTFIPFIVDGMIEDSSSNALITRTSLDHIHAPRIIPWSQVFASVKNYQRFHPLNEWSFYALY